MGLTIRFLFCCAALCGAVRLTAQQNILARVKNAQERLTHFSYRITSIDTFVNGSTRTLAGRAEILIAPQDSLGGFYFNATNESLKQQSIFEQNRLLTIDHTAKQYTLEKPLPYPNLLGSPGAQSVVRDFFVLDTAYTLSVEAHDLDSCYRITLRYADKPKYDIRDNYRIFYIDKKTMLPNRIVSHLSMAGRIQAGVKIFYDVKMLGPAASLFSKSDQQLLVSYTATNPVERPTFENLIGKKVDEFTLQTLDGKSRRLINPNAKLTLLDFWEVWCSPCIKAMPEIDALYARYKPKGLDVTGIIHEQNSAGAAKKIAVNHNSTIAHVQGNSQTETFFKVSAVPMYVLVDQERKIRYVQAGFSSQLEKEIEALLDK